MSSTTTWNTPPKASAVTPACPVCRREMTPLDQMAPSLMLGRELRMKPNGHDFFDAVVCVECTPRFRMFRR